MENFDPSEQPEVLTWRTVEKLAPPLNSMLFLRLRNRETGVINFCMGTWKDNDFLAWYIDILGRIPNEQEVTHWAHSEATNKTWFDYPWGRKSAISPPKDGRIL